MLQKYKKLKKSEVDEIIHFWKKANFLIKKKLTSSK